MQTETVEGAAERRVLIACIARTEVLGRIVGKVESRLHEGPFQSQWSNVIWGWCDRYYRKHQKAPGRTIESLFESWAIKAQDKDLKALLERFLGSLSSEYEQAQPLEAEHLIDLSEKHFNNVRLKRLETELRAAAARGDTETALKAQVEFRPVNLHSPAFINVLTDTQAQERAFQNKQKVLIRYPGPAGDFFGEELSEDSLVAFAAPPKVGKSQMLLDVAWRAMRAGINVAYFQVGDLSTNQIMQRFLLRAAYRPIGKKFYKFPVSMMMPEGHRQQPVIEWEERAFDKPMTWDMARRAFERHAKAAKAEIRLSRHVIKSVSVHDIRNILKDWDKEGWSAKVVIIDYPENLQPVNPKDNLINQTDMTWGLCKQLSETRKCLVVVAAQTNKEGYRTKWVLTRNNFRNSLMTLAHVSAFLGINQFPEEAEMQLMRLNFMVRRAEGFSENRCLWAAQSLDISNPIVLSTL